MPAARPQSNAPVPGTISRAKTASAIINSRPTAWATATTLKTAERRVAMPPQKSPVPQTAAAERLKRVELRLATRLCSRSGQGLECRVFRVLSHARGSRTCTHPGLSCGRLFDDYSVERSGGNQAAVVGSDGAEQPPGLAT